VPEADFVVCTLCELWIESEPSNSRIKYFVLYISLCAWKALKHHCHHCIHEDAPVNMTSVLLEKNNIWREILELRVERVLN